jgi:hypothetical protein
LNAIYNNPDKYRIKVGTKLEDPQEVAIDSRPLDEVRAYYRSKAGKAMACATAKKGPSYVIMGCIPATPPNDITPTVVTATRCDYFLQNRHDLSVMLFLKDLLIIAIWQLSDGRLSYAKH